MASFCFEAAVEKIVLLALFVKMKQFPSLKTCLSTDFSEEGGHRGSNITQLLYDYL